MAGAWRATTVVVSVLLPTASSFVPHTPPVVSRAGSMPRYAEPLPAMLPPEGEGFQQKNDELDAMLMERALRFYDSRFTAEREACYLVGVELTSGQTAASFTLEESLCELSELAGTAGLQVVGVSSQRMSQPNPRTYVGTGKVQEIKREMRAAGCCTAIVDAELSPGQQRNLEMEFGGEAAGIKVLDRTALILDIFAQHARTKEGQLQVELVAAPLHT